MTVRREVEIGRCGPCGASLAGGQGWCIECGEAVPGGRRDPGSLIAAAITPPKGPPIKHPGSLGILPGGRLQLFPGLDMSLRAAAVVFAGVLGLASWAGAASMGLGGGPLYALAQPSAPAPDPPAPAPGGDALDPGAALDPLAEAPLAPLVEAPLDDGLPPEDDYTPPPPPPPLKPDPPPDYTVPTLSHAWVVVLSGQGYANLFDPTAAKQAGAEADGGRPYLAGRLVPQGLVLQTLFGTSEGRLANQAALLAGQGRKDSLRNGCPSFTEAGTAGVGGSHGQAVDAKSCGFDAAVPTIFSRLAATGRSARVYSGALDADPDLTASACARPNVGEPFPAALPATTLFAGFTGRPACGSTVTGIEDLGSDLESIDSTPSFSLVLPGPCQDGSATPCAGGVPAPDGKPGGMKEADAFLESLVPRILNSAAWKDNGAIVIVSDSSNDSEDTSACCGDRPWYSADQSNGGGQLGALVLSPLVKPGTEESGLMLDHFDLLNVVSRALGVDPPGYAGHPKVTGLLKRNWGRWDGRSPRPVPR